MAQEAENAIDSYPHWPVDAWPCDLPAGRIDRIYTHWSAHDYVRVFPAYHFCIASTPDGILIVNTHDVRENMRDVSLDPQAPYAAHTRRRNSYAVGMSIMAMEGSTPQDFGAFPMLEDAIDALCRTAARIAKFYGVPLDADHVMSHAEAALHDGYFGTGDDQRWDIARLQPKAAALEPIDALTTGEELRSRMRRFQER